MILVDTSVWIEYFRATGSAAALEVRRLLSDEPDQVVTCEPIATEILAGASNEQTYRKLERLVNGLSSLQVETATDFRSAADIYRAARSTGQTIRSINDCLIAAVALRHHARVAHRDTDFEVIEGITGLMTTSLR
ncbi:type II toxin-antitoxin system VapC family toxin [Mycolicibacter senuensis]|uniref:Ribonuclease VapC n=1 Tax=Mycolicibacter senuensis TaxID=386913 RepID=A0A7I9XQ91_9MYCO|nr:PIN domain nuclease [Mycolicibacter senuensis]MDQ2627147.1 PIN domain nuclease [Actinomycetota bacterium]ORW66851.1 ribonuclease [Mycolicibacter senuensis]GFG72161.1 VapC ribonuclease [Mycolicibacter senuensis]